MTPSSSTFVSVVCRLHDDADIVESFVPEVLGVLRANYENYELVLVDDGSTDGTAAGVRALLSRHECLRYLRLSRRFGVDVALTAGLDSAIGDCVVTLSPDMDPPALIPGWVALAQRERAAIYGVAPQRSGRGLLRSLGARLFYWSCRRLFQVPVAPHATHFRVMSRQAVNAISQIKDNYRYLRALTPYTGYPTRYVDYRPVLRRPTPRAESLVDAVDTAIAVVVSNSTRPLRFVSWLAVLASLLNVGYIGYVFLVHFFKKNVAEGWATLSLQNAGMFFLLFLILAVVTEYLGRILNETRERPLYYVAEEAGSSVLIASQERRNVVTESR